MKDIMMCASELIDKLQKQNGNAQYNVVITLVPNPTNCKGLDTATIDVIMGNNQEMHNSQTIATATANSIDVCFNSLKRQIQIMHVPLSDPTVIIGGKTYRLVEVV